MYKEAPGFRPAPAYLPGKALPCHAIVAEAAIGLEELLFCGYFSLRALNAAITSAWQEGHCEQDSTHVESPPSSSSSAGADGAVKSTPAWEPLFARRRHRAVQGPFSTTGLHRAVSLALLGRPLTHHAIDHFMQCNAVLPFNIVYARVCMLIQPPSRGNRATRMTHSSRCSQDPPAWVTFSPGRPTAPT